MDSRIPARCPCGHGPGDLCALPLVGERAGAGAVDRAGWVRAVTEDVASLAESSPYLVRHGDATGPAACGRCGTLVVLVPETLATGDLPRQWAPAAWEAGLARKHTPRRCERMRDLAGTAPRHLSLLCKLHQDRAHVPCGGECDGHGSGVWCGLPCECLCHFPL